MPEEGGGDAAGHVSFPCPHETENYVSFGEPQRGGHSQLAWGTASPCFAIYEDCRCAFFAYPILLGWLCLFSLALLLILFALPFAYQVAC